MRYRELIKYLEGYHRFGIHLGLDRIKKLLKALGDPHKRFKSIHVAGTNGKGSVCAILSSILTSAGYKTGLYTSPHLVDYTERIRLSEKDISKAKFMRAVLAVKGAVKSARIKGLTEFEVITAAAFKVFADEYIDIAIIETGLGGRLDATNVVSPIVSIITNIELEHAQILGATIGKIAHEKSGIIKHGVPVVTQEIKKEALDVIKATCKKNNSQLVNVNSNSKFMIRNFTDKREKGSTFDLSGSFGEVSGVHFSMNGSGQVKNILTALNALYIRSDVLEVSRRSIIKGLANVRWPARLQFIDRNILVDGAHNPSGARFLSAYIKELKERPVLIIGMQKDKDYRGFMDVLSPVIERYVHTSSGNPLAASPQVLARYARMTRKKATVAGSILDAVRSASSGKKRKMICVAGSLYLAGELLRARNKLT